MKSLITALLALLALLISIGFAHAQDQHLNFDLIKGNKIIGSMNAWKKCQGGECAYSVNSRASLQLLITIESEVTLTANYKDGKLQASVMRNTRDEKIRESSGIFWNGESYEFLKNGESKSLGTDPVSYSSAQLLFEEPVEIDQVFSERLGTYLPLRKIDSQSYQLSLPNGNNYVYSYRDGICQEVIIEHPLGNLSLRLNPFVDQFVELVK